MDFTKLVRGFALFVAGLMLCGTLHAAAPFQVTPSALSFGEVNLGDSKTLSFKVINLQAAPLQVTISHPTGFIAINPIGQLTLGPNESKEVQARPSR